MHQAYNWLREAFGQLSIRMHQLQLQQLLWHFAMRRTEPGGSCPITALGCDAEGFISGCAMFIETLRQKLGRAQMPSTSYDQRTAAKGAVRVVN